MTRLRSPKMKQGPERHTPSGPHSFVLIPDMFTKLSQGDVPVGVGVQLHSGGVARLVLIKALTADPVSYTHLDVYKRQTQARVLIEHYYDSMAELGYARTEAAELLKEEHL